MKFLIAILALACVASALNLQKPSITPGSEEMISYVNKVSRTWTVGKTFIPTFVLNNSLKIKTINNLGWQI